jgi:hypothetical protein
MRTIAGADSAEQASELELGHTAGVTGRQGILTPLRYLIPPLVCPEVHVCLILKFVLPTGLLRLTIVYYLSKKTKNKNKNKQTKKKQKQKQNKTK